MGIATILFRKEVITIDTDDLVLIGNIVSSFICIIVLSIIFHWVFYSKPNKTVKGKKE